MTGSTRLPDDVFMTEIDELLTIALQKLLVVNIRSVAHLIL